MFAIFSSTMRVQKGWFLHVLWELICSQVSSAQFTTVWLMTTKENSWFWKTVYSLMNESSSKKCWQNLSYIIIFNESESKLFMILNCSLRYVRSFRKINRLKIKWLTESRFFLIVNLIVKFLIKKNNFSEFIEIQRKSWSILKNKDVHSCIVLMMSSSVHFKKV